MWQSLQIKDRPLQPLQNPSTAALTSSKSMSPPPLLTGAMKDAELPSRFRHYHRQISLPSQAFKRFPTTEYLVFDYYDALI